MKKILSLFLVLALVCCAALSFAETATTVTGTGTAAGYGGEISVTVTLDGDQIVAVEMTGKDETPGIGSKILEEYPALFVENNGLVDAYSGATFAQYTRTGVLAAMALALQEAGVDPTAYNREPAEAAAAEDVTIEADIVIVGAGGAGMTAAITAADAGKNVVVLEREPAVGGNSVKSTGGMNAGKTVYQDQNEFGESAGVEKTLKAAEGYADNEAITALAAKVKEQWDAYQAAPEGYFDSTELFALDTLIGGKGLNDPELVNTLVNNSAAAIDYLRPSAAPPSSGFTARWTRTARPSPSAPTRFRCWRKPARNGTIWP